MQKGWLAKSLEERYDVIRRSAQSRSVLSVGISTFQLISLKETDTKKNLKYKCQVHLSHFFFNYVVVPMRKKSITDGWQRSCGVEVLSCDCSGLTTLQKDFCCNTKKSRNFRAHLTLLLCFKSVLTMKSSREKSSNCQLALLDECNNHIGPSLLESFCMLC